MKTIVIAPTSQKKWLETLDIRNQDWRKYYLLPYRTTNDSKLRILQFKIIHRILATNKRLKLFGYKDSDLCDFCKTEIETISHLFWECGVTKQFIRMIFSYLLVKCNIHIQESMVNMIFGILPIKDNLVTNNFLLILKNYIFRKSHQAKELNFTEFQKYIEHYQSIEESYLPYEIWVKKWVPVLDFWK